MGLPPFPIGMWGATYLTKVLGIAPANVLALWTLGDASGLTATDASGNGRTGTYVNTPTLAQPGIGDGRTAVLFDGSNDLVNLFTTSLRDAWPSNGELTVMLWAKVASAGVLTDATVRQLAFFQVDANNFCNIRRNTTTNQYQAVYTAGGTAKAVVFTTSSTAWQLFALTASKSADQVKAYVGGVQVGTTQTGLGVWAGTLATALLGASTTGGSGPYSGAEQHAAVFNIALSPAQIAAAAVVP